MSNEEKTEDVVLSIKITPELKNQLERIAEREHRSVSSQVRLFLTQSVSHLNTQGGAEK